MPYQGNLISFLLAIAELDGVQPGNPIPINYGLAKAVSSLN